MNFSWSSLYLEFATVGLGLAILVADLWTPVEHKRKLGFAAAGGLLLLLLASFVPAWEPAPGASFGGMITMDPLALFFKRLFLAAGFVVALMTIEFAPQIKAGIAEYHTLQLMALAGMLFAASATDLSMMFVCLELITVSFYVLTSFQRGKTASLEAGVKYLIIGALSSGFLVFGIALVFGTSNSTRFQDIALKAPALIGNKLFLAGLILVLGGFLFKIAAVPLHMWAPDVYQGAPAPTTALLSVGSKAAGFVLLVRWTFSVVPDVALKWEKLLLAIAGCTILYGSLCALPQRDLKRLLGYSSIANAGFLLLGVAAMTPAGSTAILFYLGTYAFAVLGIFTVITLLSGQQTSVDFNSLAGLSKRSPYMAACLTLCVVSLAGIPPLVGFTGKFLLIKSALEQGVSFTSYYALVGVALFGVVASFYYYFGLIRAAYWAPHNPSMPALPVSTLAGFGLGACAAAVVVLGIVPKPLLAAAEAAVKALRN